MYTPSQLCGTALTAYQALHTCLCSGACASSCATDVFCMNEMMIGAACVSCASTSCLTQLDTCQAN
jgi:hypothetical protein